MEMDDTDIMEDTHATIIGDEPLRQESDTLHEDDTSTFAAEIVHPKMLKVSIATYQRYQEIRVHVRSFEDSLSSNQGVAITPKNFPLFTEMQLVAITSYASGVIVIDGLANGNKKVSVLEQISELSYALSESSRSRSGTKERRRVELTFVQDQ